MYRTPDGERVLGHHEARVFRAMLGLTLSCFEPGPADSGSEDATCFGIPAFDSMTRGQKLWSLRLVARALLLKDEPAPPLVAYAEATVASVFTGAGVLLDMERTDEGVGPFRGMLVDAIREVDDQVPECHETDGHFLVECLQDQILWDLDFLETETLDRSPEEAQQFREEMGIQDDYLIAVAEDPLDSEIDAIYAELLTLAGKL